MKKVISLVLVTVLMLAMVTVSFNASFSVSDKDEDGNPIIWSASDAIAAYEQEYGEEVVTKRIYFQMPDGNRGAAATADHSVTLTDYAPMTDPETGEPLFDAETGEPIMEAVGYHDEVVIHEGEKAPSWYNDFNVLDGHTYAAAYWWGGTADPQHFTTLTDGTPVGQDWCGYRAEIADEAQGIYYIDLPDDVTTVIWNNGVNGGMDSSQPIYYMAAQTGNLNAEGAFPDDYDTIPYGSPDPWYFGDCIYVIDPDQVDVNPLTNKQTCGGNWYVYYGNGCYGAEFAQGFGDDTEYPDGTPGWTGEMQDVCQNPDHYVDGVHVGYHEGGEDPTEPPHVHTPAAAVTENEVKPTYKAGGSYDSVVYCSECGEEISRETINTDPIALDPNKLYFDASSTGWEMGTKNKIAFHIFGGDLTNGLDWGARKAIGTATAGADGLFEIDPVAKMGYSFTPGVQYKIIFVRTDVANWTSQTYDLLFTTDCFGHVAYADGTEYENPVDSTKKTLAAFWYGMDASEYGPVLQVSSIGNVVGTCPETGRTPLSIFNDFCTYPNTEFGGKTGLENARYYTVEQAKTKTEQEMIDDIGAGLGLTKQEVYDTLITGGVETVWDYTVSNLPGDVVPPTEPPVETEAPVTEAPHVHTPGEPTQENVVPASCTAEGSYDEVVYCTECGEEISREHKTIEKTAHSLKRVNGKPATADADGWYSHYEWKVCGKYFTDATGAVEVTWDQIRIPKLNPDPTDPPETQAPETEPPVPTDPPETEPPVVVTTAVLGDADGSGEVDILDVTLIQRVLVNITPGNKDIIARGDVDKNGSLETIDATRIQRYLLALDDGLGIGKDFQYS